MKTKIQDINKAKETRSEVVITLKNGKRMFVDFADNTVCRFSDASSDDLPF